MTRPPENPSRKLIAVSLLLVLATFVVYWRTQFHSLLFFDDRDYLQEWHVRQGLNWGGIVWAFTKVHFSNWHPLTSIVYMLERQVFGLNARAFHLVEIFGHALNTLVLFGLLRRMTGF